jgi:hypothetical protein
MVDGQDIGSGTSALVVALETGANTITNIVTAADGLTQVTYIVSVSRVSSDASLSEFDIAGYAITPDFSSETTEYSLVVPEVADQLTFAITASNPGASIIADGQDIGSGTSALVVPLVMGMNTVTSVVTAADGLTQMTYVVSVLRASSDATLSDLYLTITSGWLDFFFPPFTPAGTVYSATGVGEFTITPTAADANAIIRVEGIVVATGEASVNGHYFGPTGSDLTYTIEVTAEDGVTVMIYSIVAVVPPT